MKFFLDFTHFFKKLLKKVKNISKKVLTIHLRYAIISTFRKNARWCGSMAEQLICNQQVVGSTPITSSIFLGDFPSGQRGQTVNLLSLTSVVRIHHPPPEKSTFHKVLFSRTFNIACVSFFINPFFIVFQQKTDPLGWSFVVFTYI